MDANTPKRWMTRAEAAQYMGVTEHTIDNWRRQGKLTKHTIKGLQSVRYALEELDALVVPEEGVDDDLVGASGCP